MDVSLSNITPLERMIIKIPMGSAGNYVASGQALYITEGGSYVPVPSRIQGGEVWIYTDHNTSYVYVATSYSDRETYEAEPDLGTDEPSEPEGWPPYNPGWDDDDVVVLPTIVYEDSGSGDDDGVKVAACAAAAVAAAILACLIIMEHRKR